MNGYLIDEAPDINQGLSRSGRYKTRTYDFRLVRAKLSRQAGNLNYLQFWYLQATFRLIYTI